MRRSALTLFAVTAILAVAACAPDSAERAPLVPTEPSLAVADQCSGGLMSTINKNIKDGFSNPAEADLLDQAAVIKNLCPNAFPQLMSFLESVIGYSGAPVNAVQGTLLSTLVANITNYVTASPVVRPKEVWMNQGGIAVLTPPEVMTTFDNRARLELVAGTTPGGPHLWTFDARPTSECDGTTSLRITGNCYQVSDYPHETSYSPRFIYTQCIHSSFGPTGIGHEKSGFGAEVLPEASVAFSCAHTLSALDGWLGREAGPLGRSVARAYDYLRPRSLFADDAGESGSSGSASLFGGILNVIFEDDFEEINNPPDIGDSWLVQDDGTGPGYIQVQSGLGDLTGSVVALSQGQGACQNCPTFQLLGTRVNSTQTETVGTYEVTWQSVQTKPNVKEAPFVVLNDAGAEIARLSYVSESNHNIIRFNGDSVGTWVQNTHQDFKITVNLTAQAPAVSNSVSLSINGTPVVTNQAAPNATTLKQIGYRLMGIDAGIIGADNFRVIRLSDGPPNP